MNNFAEAIKCFDKAIKLEPTNPKVYLFRISPLSKMKKYDEIIHCYDRLIELEPKNAYSYNGKGKLS